MMADTRSPKRSSRRAPLLGSLRSRFLVAFVLLGVLPLLAAVAFVGHRSRANLEQQSITLQEEVAFAVADQLHSVILGRERELIQLDEVAGLGSASAADQEVLLQNLLASQRMYQDLALLDAGGREQIRVARDEVVVDNALTDRSADIAFTTASRDKVTYFGPVTFDEAAREPLTVMAYPLMNRQSGEVADVLVATVRFKPIWDLLGQLDLSGGRQVFIVNQAGDVVAHPNPGVVLRGTSYSPPEIAGSTDGLSGEKVVAATAVVAFGQQRLLVVAEQPSAAAFALATDALQITVVVMILTVLAAIALALGGNRFFVKPVEQLAAAAQRVAGGNLGERVPVRSRDEIGALAGTFNEMTSRLQTAFASLEKRVAERTADLEAATAEQARLIDELESRNGELVRVQQQLEDLIRSKDRFLGAVSHELRTPLASVLGFAEILRDSYPSLDDAELHEFLTRIADEGRDMADIINDLLVAARAETGQLAIDLCPVDLGADINTVVSLLPDVPARIDLPQTSVKALADPVRVRQIMRNLVVNAGRYGGSEVEICLSHNDGHAIVQVCDNGTGIPEDEWETIFDPYRTSQHQTNQPASVGLGLTISRLLARRMAGDLTYRFEDARSIFELKLPASASE